jgi:hypothetical protein
MKIVKSESTVMPDETYVEDKTVFVRSSIEAVVRDEVTYYSYDETQYTKEEWADLRVTELEAVIVDLSQTLVDKGVIY